MADFWNSLQAGKHKKSTDWLRNKIRNSGQATVTKPKIGGLYVFVYLPKTEDILPFWDSNPLIAAVGFEKGGFYGLNFHYLPIPQRKALFSILEPLLGTDRSRAAISYKRLLSLSSGLWRPCFKRYLYSCMRTKLVEIPKEEWVNALSLPIAQFRKAGAMAVYKDSKKKI